MFYWKGQKQAFPFYTWLTVNFYFINQQENCEPWLFSFCGSLNKQLWKHWRRKSILLTGYSNIWSSITQPGQSRKQENSREHNYSILYRGTWLPANPNIFIPIKYVIQELEKKKRSGCKYISCFPTRFSLYALQMLKIKFVLSLVHFFYDT